MEIPTPDKVMPRRKARSSNQSDCGIDIPALVAELLAAVATVHQQHLLTDSYSEHKALDGLYLGLQESADTIAEVGFGYAGKPSSFPATTIKYQGDCCGYVKELRYHVQEARDACTLSNLQNELDELLSLLDQTCYLLTLK